MNTPFLPSADSGLSFAGAGLHVAGAVANPVVQALYPLPALTRWHAQHHLPGLTGRWTDTGSTALGGAVRGPFHRLAHGHHLFEDGLKVILHPRLRYGEFLHHLGLDFLTRTGLPNPLLPKVLGEAAVALGRRLGVPAHLLHDLLTVNAPKVFGGGLALVCAGPDVVGAFSDAIPHTFGAAGMHLAAGVFDCVLGCYPPNPVLLVAGGAELGVGALTALRAWTDPVLPALGMPASVFVPLLGGAMGLAGALGLAGGALLTGSLAGGLRRGACASLAAGASVTVAAMAKAAALPFAPLAGPAAGYLLYRLARHLLEPRPAPSSSPLDAGLEGQVAGLGAGSLQLLPALVPTSRPLGRLEGSRLWLLDAASSLDLPQAGMAGRGWMGRPPRMSWREPAAMNGARMQA